MAHERPILLDIPEEFVGSRVVLRPFADADAAPLFAAVQESVEHIRPWLPWYDAHHSVNDTLEFIRRRRAAWVGRDDFSVGVFARGDGAFLGGSGLHVRDWQLPSFEIGYWLRRAAEGHGYMSEAVRLLTAYAFEGLGAQRVMIRCDSRNLRSKRIPERLGYVCEGCLRRSTLDTSRQPFDMLIYAMIPEDYERARAAWPPASAGA